MTDPNDIREQFVRLFRSHGIANDPEDHQCVCADKLTHMVDVSLVISGNEDHPSMERWAAYRDSEKNNE